MKTAINAEVKAQDKASNQKPEKTELKVTIKPKKERPILMAAHL